MICRDEAIVLKTRDFRETSKIAIFYSKEFGKISGLLKGIRADPRKFSSNLDFLSINEIIFYKKRVSELHLVSQCDLRRSFDGLRSDIAKFSLGSFCAEFIDFLIPSEDPHPEIYHLLVNFLESVEHSEPSQKLLFNLIIKSLTLSGFQPHLENCVVCKNPIKNKGFFSNRFGGLLCADCFNKDDSSEIILKGTVATILFFQHTKWSDSMRLQILPSIEKELGKIIFSFLHFNIERKFKSLALFNETMSSSLAA